MATEIDFNVDLVNFSEWYDKNNLVRQLKVLYHDLISVADIDKANTTIDLLNALRKTGRLSPGNLELLYETIKVTQTFGAIKVFQQSIFEVQEIQIINFTPYRHWIADFGNELRKAAVKKIDALFNNPLKNYEDSWSMIIDLEQRQILCEEKKEEFINILNKIGLASTMKCLTQEELPTTSCRPNNEQGIQAEDNSGGSKMTGRKKRQTNGSESESEEVPPTSGRSNEETQKEVKSETVNVPNTSNKEQGTQKAETEKIQTYLIKIQTEKCKQASTFTPATMNDIYKVDISHMFTDMELLTESENNKETSKPTTLEEVIDVISSKPGCKALIEGEGDFNLETDLPNDPRLIKKFIKIHEGKIVLLLDGLDELRFNNQTITRIFSGNSFKKSTVVLTSRSENINYFIKSCNVHVRVKGFNKDSIGKYIVNHFKYFGKPELGESLKEELDIHSYLAGRKHEEAYLMCKNPMLLLSICILWEDNESLPSDSSDLFKQLFRSILNQFNKQKQFAKISKFEHTPAKYIHAMILLGKCMYKKLKENQLSINMKDLNDTHSTRDMIDMAVKLGFVYEEAPILKSNFESVFMPPHKLIVESLVGLYLSKLCESDGIENEFTEDVRRILTPLDDTEWQVIRESEYLNKAREFAIGFLGANANAFLKHWVTNSLSTYRSLPSNLKFVKKNHKDAVVNALNYHIQDLEIKNPSADIATSIGFFIKHISPGEQCDGHFNRLIMQLYCMKDFDEEIAHFSSSRIAGECKGKVIAHILAIAEYDEYMIIENLLKDADAFKHFVTECSLKQVQLALRYLDISGNNLHNIDVNSLCLIMCPKLRVLDMRDCNLSGDVINHLGTECSLKQVQLALRYLFISGNNLHNLDVNSMSSLLIMCPKLEWLNMRDCNLSGEKINYLTEVCLKRKIPFCY
ncbi:uncharacterized protein [Antedon mediterranea]|uniref:uncharacterized protein isoform X2 n=1 Tax=Antedon mediterranea TaxID=105859 RepID=UPI003AF99384